MTVYRIPLINACDQCYYYLKPKPEYVPRSERIYGPGMFDYGRDLPPEPEEANWCSLNKSLVFKRDHKGLHRKCPLPKVEQ